MAGRSKAKAKEAAPQPPKAKRNVAPAERRAIEMALPPEVSAECVDIANRCGMVTLQEVRNVAREAGQAAATAAVLGRVAHLVREKVDRSLGGKQVELPNDETEASAELVSECGSRARLYALTRLRHPETDEVIEAGSYFEVDARNIEKARQARKYNNTLTAAVAAEADDFAPGLVEINGKLVPIAEPNDEDIEIDRLARAAHDPKDGPFGRDPLDGDEP